MLKLSTDEKCVTFLSRGAIFQTFYIPGGTKRRIKVYRVIHDYPRIKNNGKIAVFRAKRNKYLELR